MDSLLESFQCQSVCNGYSRMIDAHVGFLAIKDPLETSPTPDLTLLPMPSLFKTEELKSKYDNEDERLF